MSKTNAEARALCRLTCLDCCCREHHWGDYGGDNEEGFEDAGDGTYMSCKHCLAKIDYAEVCTSCGKELIAHDLDSWACDIERHGPFGGPKFTYAGQPERECKLAHPWEEGA